MELYEAVARTKGTTDWQPMLTHGLKTYGSMEDMLRLAQMHADHFPNNEYKAVLTQVN